MTLRARAAEDVDPVVGEAEFAHRNHRHHRERFVDLEQVDVIRLPAQLREQRFDGADRRRR